MTVQPEEREKGETTSWERRREETKSELDFGSSFEVICIEVVDASTSECTPNRISFVSWPSAFDNRRKRN